MSKKSNEDNKALDKSKESKENLGTRFIKIIKKRWLIQGTTTLLLVAILIAIFVLINIGVKKLNITAIDCTTSKDYTLTDQSKDRIKDISKEVKIYFAGFDEDNVSYKLANQYNKANSNIKIELVDTNKNIEFTKKYNITDATSNPVIVVECGKESRTISSYDIYDYYSGEDTTETKLTSAILNVSSTETPKAYFLEGYTSLSFEKGLYKLSQFLKDEVLTYQGFNVLNTGKVPDDCDTLIIVTPEKDFDDVATKAIIDYIEKGGNILWLNSARVDEKASYKNVNKVLSQYGVKEFETGCLYETDNNNTLLGYPTIFKGQMQESDVTKDIDNNTGGVVFFTATKLNFDTDKFEKLKVEKTDLILTSDTTYFTKDLTGKMDKKKDEKGAFTIGAQLKKTIKESNDESQDGVESRLIIYGNDVFVTDTLLTYTNTNTPIYAIDILNNADVVLNSIGVLTNKDENITIRRDYADAQTTFTATDGQTNIIVKIIFVVPVAIIALGIIVWIIRKNKK
ncbi:Gldg family protein [Romboutsia sp.]|uniref:Gldg family protein n=1 Tax=Romboutsia sp. TaxID=1965302 RepID=UPI002173CE12|nr:Gldg family protein [Romboutsia sp.]MCI9062848.1 hypothetical protein [Romboutsia sp.]